MRLAVAVIGAGKMAYDCIRCILGRQQLQLRLLVSPVIDDHASRRLAQLCASHAIPRICTSNPNDDEIVAAVRAQRPALIFNINSLDILGPHMLSTAPIGIVNFHNGPLPRYAGVLIPTWAIWNGESQHGVTWHFMTAGIDDGNILAQSKFPIHPDATAAGLMFDCIIRGTQLFEHVLEIMIAGERSGTPQRGPRTYYGRDRIPNDGWLDPGWPIETVDRFLRALDYRPFPNPVAYPRLATEAGGIRIERAVVLASEATPPPAAGTVIRVDDEIRVGVRDGQIAIKAVVDSHGRSLPIAEVVTRHGLRAGSRLPAPP